MYNQAFNIRTENVAQATFHGNGSSSWNSSTLYLRPMRLFNPGKLWAIGSNYRGIWMFAVNCTSVTIRLPIFKPQGSPVDGIAGRGNPITFDNVHALLPSGKTCFQ